MEKWEWGIQRGECQGLFTVFLEKRLQDIHGFTWGWMHGSACSMTEKGKAMETGKPSNLDVSAQ